MSTVTYSGDGANTDFTINYPFLSRDFIKVFVDSVEQTADVNYTFISDTVVRINSPTPPSGTDNVELRRVTSTTPIVDFENGAAADEVDFDSAFQQALHLVEEARRDAISGMGKDGVNWDGEGVRITDLAAPILGTDAATLNSITPQVSAAAASAAAAAASETAAETAETGAEAAEATALAAAGAANTSASNANVAALAAIAAQGAIEGVYPTSGFTSFEVLHATGPDTMAAVPMKTWPRTSSGTASAAADLEIAIPDNSLNHFKLVIEDFLPVSNNVSLVLEASDDGGATWHTTSGDYHMMLNAPNAAGGNNNAVGTNQSAWTLTSGQSNTRRGRYIELDLHLGNGANTINIIQGNTIYEANFGPSMVHGDFAGDLRATTNRIDRLRLRYSSGNISFLVYTLYSGVY